MGTTDRVRVNTDTENTAIERTARIFLERDQAKSAGRGFMTAGEVFMSMAVLINIVTKNAQGISRYLARNGEVGRAANTLFTAIHPGDALIVSWSMALAGLSLFFSGKLYNLFRVNQFKSDMAKKAGSF
jgi:hypothetical protein